MSIEKTQQMLASPTRSALAGPGFALLTGAAAPASLACAPSTLAGPALYELVRTAEENLGVDAQLAVLLTLEPIGCPNIYYLPLANDVRGIGYVHHDPREVFDETPDHRLEGIAFLNDWPYWHAHPFELESAFNHELGHRFGARVRALVGDRPSTALLGRDLEHWSYFLSTLGSPLEGNVWTERGSGYISDTPLYPARFSPLDLYLMGVVPAAEVPAQRLLIETSSSDADCAGQPIARGSPPQTCSPVALSATSTLVSIEDIIAVEGPRDPAPERMPRSIDVLALMLESGQGELSIADCEGVQAALRERIAGFATSTRGGIQLRNVLSEDVGCAELGARASALRDETRPLSAGGVDDEPSCALVHRARHPFVGLAVWGLVLLAAAARRERYRANAL